MMTERCLTLVTDVELAAMAQSEFEMVASKLDDRNEVVLSKTKELEDVKH
jgi:hypothetical protein